MWMHMYHKMSLGELFGHLVEIDGWYQFRYNVHPLQLVMFSCLLCPVIRCCLRSSGTTTSLLQWWTP